MTKIKRNKKILEEEIGEWKVEFEIDAKKWKSLWLIYRYYSIFFDFKSLTVKFCIYMIKTVAWLKILKKNKKVEKDD